MAKTDCDIKQTPYCLHLPAKIFSCFLVMVESHRGMLPVCVFANTVEDAVVLFDIVAAELTRAVGAGELQKGRLKCAV